MSKLNYGDIVAQEVSGRVGAPVANATALSTIPKAALVNGQSFLKLDDLSTWIYLAAATATDASLQLVIPATTAGVGAFVRAPGTCELILPIAYTNTDAEVLLTTPTGCRWALTLAAYWEVTTGFTGGSSSAIGLSSSKTGFTTKGDILGGASGDVTATLGTTGLKLGTIGAKLDGDDKRAIFVSGETIRFDRITSVFTAGAGYAKLGIHLLENLGV